MDNSKYNWADVRICIAGHEIKGVREIKYKKQKRKKMIYHSTQNITIAIDKLIDTIVVIGDKVDENAIAHQVIAALNKAVTNAHKTDPRLMVAYWGMPQPKIKRDDLKDWAKAFDAARIPMSCFTRACADFVSASIEAAKDREERIAAMRKDFDLWSRYYFPHWFDCRPFSPNDL
ncbi:hypothetical protein [Dysgonomonas sp. GY617]|uniref:hypothetical protein n=1 Tax=Dysgonomonas sp. GY617 TaxID=2780420 RepID=UPI001883799C|nr:hypothetical protein [Dysgonomonas sp. GY617]MBF0576616.1 hypothetical protein [Dysgonomonas sp. GY617]